VRELALLAHDPADFGQFGPERLIRDDDVVEPVGDLARHTCPSKRHPNAEVAVLDLRQDAQQHRLIELVASADP
jgi:hypothetical protein